MGFTFLGPLVDLTDMSGHVHYQCGGWLGGLVESICKVSYRGDNLYPELSFISGFRVLISIDSLILLANHVVSEPRILMSFHLML